jgi:hypothetical protein
MSHREDQQKSPAKRFLFIFGFIRIAFFLVLGLLILFTDFIPFNVDKPFRITFGVILVLYALGRAYGEYKSNKY